MALDLRRSLQLAWLAVRYRLDADARGYLRTAGPLPRSLPGDPRACARALASARFFPARRDWEWPYWAVRQFDPAAPDTGPAPCDEFNAAHRNWTALGLPGHARRAAVDPRGLVTPWPDGVGWSLDAWVRLDDRLYTPAHAAGVRQRWLRQPPGVVTEWPAGPLQVAHHTTVIEHEREPWALVEVTLANGQGAAVHGELVLALRPYNPEGLARAWRVEYRGLSWHVAGHLALIAPPPAAFGVSDGARGDVAAQLGALNGEDYAFDRDGLATGAATYPFSLAPGQDQTFVAAMPLSTSRIFAVAPLPLGWHVKFHADMRQAWGIYLDNSLTAQWPDERLQAAFDANKEHLLVAWTGNSVMRGPLASPAFRFRQAAPVTQALDLMGLHLEAQHVLRTYATRLKGDGRFDDGTAVRAANGQALWSLWQHVCLTGDDEFLRLMAPITRAAAAWILKSGSARQYTPEDDLWSAAGLQAATEWVRAAAGDPAPYEQAFRGLWARVEQAWANTAPPRDVLAASVPLRLLAPDDTRVTAALEAARGAGLPAGGTVAAMELAHAHVLRRSRACWPSIDALLDGASGTWAWPEHTHPVTGEGGMGEGHSTRATAAWLSLLRSLLLFEDGRRLVLTPALRPEWLRPETLVSAGQAPTAFGRVDFTLAFGERCATLALAGRWRTPPEEIELNLPVPAAGVHAAGARIQGGDDAVRVVAPGTVEELRVEW